MLYNVYKTRTYILVFFLSAVTLLSCVYITNDNFSVLCVDNMNKLVAGDSGGMYCRKCEAKYCGDISCYKDEHSPATQYKYEEGTGNTIYGYVAADATVMSMGLPIECKTLWVCNRSGNVECNECTSWTIESGNGSCIDSTMLIAGN